MKKNIFAHFFITIFVLISVFIGPTVSPQENTKKQNLDEQVRSFLENKRDSWRDMNVPESDGKLLYDLIIKNKYTKALEIGTSTGHSGIWIAWALSKTGGKLITIEIDEDRYREAIANFKEAGLSNFVEAKLADAHELVKELKGPFDFVFSDADKGWYKNYFIDVYPKLDVGGCYTAHNVSGGGRGRRSEWGAGEFYAYVSGLPNMKTTVDNSGGGLSISFKKSDK